MLSRAHTPTGLDARGGKGHGAVFWATTHAHHSAIFACSFCPRAEVDANVVTMECDDDEMGFGHKLFMPSRKNASPFKSKLVVFPAENNPSAADSMRVAPLEDSDDDEIENLPDLRRPNLRSPS